MGRCEDHTQHALTRFAFSITVGMTDYSPTGALALPYNSDNLKLCRAWSRQVGEPGWGSFSYERGTPVGGPPPNLGQRQEPCHSKDYPFSAQALAVIFDRKRILCTGGPDVIRKEAWPFYRTISGVRLCWELEEPAGPNI